MSVLLAQRLGQALHVTAVQGEVLGVVAPTRHSAVEELHKHVTQAG